MLYTIAEILFFLAVAAVLGGLVGWYWRGSSLRNELLAGWSRERDRINMERDAAVDQSDALRKDLTEAKSAVKAAQDAQQKAEQERDESRRLAEEIQDDLSKAESALEGAQKSATEAKATADQAEKNAAAAESKLSELKQDLSEAKAALKTCRDDADDNKAELRSSQGRVAAMETELAQAKQALADCEAGQKSKPAPAAKASDDDADKARAQVMEIAKRTAGDNDVADDDLKRIKGVGPKIETMLKEMGITSYQQIAQFTDEDVAVVASALKAFPDRMLRDDWKGQATDLHKEVHG